MSSLSIFKKSLILLIAFLPFFPMIHGVQSNSLLAFREGGGGMERGGEHSQFGGQRADQGAHEGDHRAYSPEAAKDDAAAHDWDRSGGGGFYDSGSSPVIVTPPDQDYFDGDAPINPAPYPQ